MGTTVFGRAAVTLALGLITAAAAGDTFLPLEQDRYTSVQVQTRCGGESSEGEAAVAFEPFDSVVGSLHECPGEPTLVGVTANQMSTIGGSALSVVAVAHYSAQSPGSVFASSVSSFSVTFELLRASVIALEGVLLGSGPSAGVEAFMRLSGPREAITDHTLTGPFPPGEATMLVIDEDHILAPGIYTVDLRALAADAIDIAKPIFVAEADLSATIDISVLGDTNGDEIVDVVDLIHVIQCWGTPGIDCPEPGIDADVNRDGTVDVLDLVAVIVTFGT